MNPYLAKLRALECARHPAEGRQRGFEGFEGATSSPISESEISKSASFENPQNLQNPPYREEGSERLNHILGVLREGCPEHVEHARWRQAVEDGRRFLSTWGAQAGALGWTVRDLFGLHTPRMGHLRIIGGYHAMTPRA